MKKLLLLLLFTILGCSSSSTIKEETKSKQTPIVGGNQVSHADYPSIAALVDEDGRAFCSATMINNDALITAEHCVNDDEVYSVVYGYSNPKDSRELLKPFKTILHTWEDIAVVVLDEEIPDVECDPILSVEKHKEYLSPESWVTIVGYGRTDPLEYGGILHAASTVVTNLFPTEVYVGNLDTPVACFGDSGGPIYVWNSEGTRYVSGVASRVVAQPYCLNGAAYILPGNFIDWIEEEYEQAVFERDGIEIIPVDFVAKNEDCEKTYEPRYYVAGGGCSIEKSRDLDNSFLLIIGIVVLCGFFRRIR